MKTPEEIKKGLWCCQAQYSASCGKCPYSNDGRDCGRNGVQIMKDALAYIQQLEQELAAVKRERDAAVADLASIPRCKVCVNLEKDNYEEPCDSCAHIAFMGDVRGNWEWRGVCPENTDDDRSCLNCKHQGAEGRGICMDCSFDYKKWEPLESTEVQKDD